MEAGPDDYEVPAIQNEKVECYDVRNVALETLSETRKRKSAETDGKM